MIEMCPQYNGRSRIHALDHADHVTGGRIRIVTSHNIHIQTTSGIKRTGLLFLTDLFFQPVPRIPGFCNQLIHHGRIHVGINHSFRKSDSRVCQFSNQQHRCRTFLQSLRQFITLGSIAHIKIKTFLFILIPVWYAPFNDHNLSFYIYPLVIVIPVFWGRDSIPSIYHFCIFHLPRIRVHPRIKIPREDIFLFISHFFQSTIDQTRRRHPKML